jgi:4a-hydroxytetrahydrobiopterin dehydratase
VCVNEVGQICFPSKTFGLQKRVYCSTHKESDTNIKLNERRCIPCEGQHITPLSAEKIEELKRQLHSDWKICQEPTKKLSRTYVMKNFVSALTFINKIGEIAEAAGHHPGKLSKKSHHSLFTYQKNFLFEFVSLFFEPQRLPLTSANNFVDLHLVRYRHLTIEWYTHSINGLSENDFICAAKTDQLSEQAEKLFAKKMS